MKEDKKQGYEIDYKLKEPWQGFLESNKFVHGRGERTQTFDLPVPNRARYQLRHTPIGVVLELLYPILCRMKTLLAVVKLRVVNDRKQKQLISSEKVRFVLVGGTNTAVDFIILFLLASILNVPVFLANIVSTSVALGVSYVLNKKAVFKNDSATNLRQIMAFIVVTLVGLWVLQGTIIWLVGDLLQSLSLNETIVLFLGKVIASAFSLTWNYLWYSRVVFRQQNHSEK